MSSLPWKWFIEHTHPTQAHMHGVEKYVFSGKTPFQTVEIIDTDFFGRCLVLDGKIQSTEFDEYIYHETLIHPAMITHPHPESVLVVGGGEGAVLREILKHPSVKKVVMVDIDKEVVELCREYFPHWSNGGFVDPRVEVLYMDARRYLEENDATWDVIFFDLTEPLDDSPSYLLFTKEFYAVVTRRLHEGGCIALQGGNLNPRLIECHGAVYNTLKLSFNNVASYGAYIPSYDTMWGFITASRDLEPRDIPPEIVDKKLGEERNILDLRYYDGLTHQHMFALPKDIRKQRSAEKRIIEDDKPLFVY